MKPTLAPALPHAFLHPAQAMRQLSPPQSQAEHARLGLDLFYSGTLESRQSMTTGKKTDVQTNATASTAPSPAPNSRPRVQALTY